MTPVIVQVIDQSTALILVTIIAIAGNILVVYASIFSERKKNALQGKMKSVSCARRSMAT
jgi:hypothetical protein